MRVVSSLAILALISAGTPVDDAVRADAVVDATQVVPRDQAVDAPGPVVRGLPAAEPEPGAMQLAAPDASARPTAQRLRLQSTEPPLRLGCPPQGPPAVG